MLSPTQRLFHRPGKGVLSDAIIRAGIQRLCSARWREIGAHDPVRNAMQFDVEHFVRQMHAAPIAVQTHSANEQHYEVPAAFFEMTLSPRPLWRGAGITGLAQAEAAALLRASEYAALEDGQDIHRSTAYLFEVRTDDDWISRHFFSDRMMPSDDLALQVHAPLRLAPQWKWDGTHYARTAPAPHPWWRAGKNGAC